MIKKKNFWEKIVDLINLDKLKDTNGKLLYPNSDYTYCKKCWNNREKLDFKFFNVLSFLLKCFVVHEVPELTVSV